jgi:hypothetical protein
MSGHITIPHFTGTTTEYPAFEEAYKGHDSMSEFLSVENECEITIPAAMLAIRPTKENLTRLERGVLGAAPYAAKGYYMSVGGAKDKIKSEHAIIVQKLLEAIQATSQYGMPVTQLISPVFNDKSKFYSRVDLKTIQAALQYAAQGYFVHILPYEDAKEQDIDANALATNIVNTYTDATRAQVAQLTPFIRHLKERGTIPPIRQAFKLQIQPIDKSVPVEFPGETGINKRKIVPLAGARGLKRSIGG